MNEWRAAGRTELQFNSQHSTFIFHKHLFKKIFPGALVQLILFLNVFFLSYFGLCCVFVTMWAFPSCGMQGLLSSCKAWASHCGGLPCCRSQVLAYGLQQLQLRRLQSTGLVIVAQGLVALQRVGSSWVKRLNPCPLHWQMDSLLPWALPGEPQPHSLKTRTHD